MPLYVYKCENKDCSVEIEELQSLLDKPLIICPRCGLSTLKKQVTSFNGSDKSPVWDKHADFIKKLKPKYVKDGKTGERKRLR